MSDVAATTIVTLAEMRAFLNIPITQTGKDDLLISLLDAYNGKIENYLGVTLINSTYTTEKYDGNDTDSLFLKHYPIVSVSELIIGDDTLTASDFVIYDEGYLKIDSDTYSIFTKDVQNVSVTYIAGWGTSRANVNDVLKNALKTWVMRVFKAEVVDFSMRFDESSLANIKSQMMPWDIKQDLDYYRCRRWGRID